MNTENSDAVDQKPEQPQTKTNETPALWVEGHLRIFDPETNQQIVNMRA